MQDMRRSPTEFLRYTEKDRAKIADDTEKFLQDGGEIQTLPSNLSSKHTGRDVLRIHRTQAIERKIAKQLQSPPSLP